MRTAHINDRYYKVRFDDKRFFFLHPYKIPHCGLTKKLSKWKTAQKNFLISGKYFVKSICIVNKSISRNLGQKFMGVEFHFDAVFLTLIFYVKSIVAESKYQNLVFWKFQWFWILKLEDLSPEKWQKSLKSQIQGCNIFQNDSFWRH